MEQLSTKFWEISQTAYAHGSPWTAEQFASDIKQAHSHYFTEGTEIIAFLGFHQVCDEIEITNIAVQSKGQGHGKRLLKRLIKHAKSQRIVSIFGSTCFESGGASFYENFGFQEMATRKITISTLKKMLY